jgi:hypothetical protein
MTGFLPEMQNHKERNREIRVRVSIHSWSKFKTNVYGPLWRTAKNSQGCPGSPKHSAVLSSRFNTRSSENWTRMGEIMTGHTRPNPIANHCPGRVQSAPVGKRLGPVPVQGIHILARHTHTIPTNTPRGRLRGKSTTVCLKLNSFDSYQRATLFDFYE